MNIPSLIPIVSKKANRSVSRRDPTPVYIHEHTHSKWASQLKRCGRESLVKDIIHERDKHSPTRLKPSQTSRMPKLKSLPIMCSWQCFAKHNETLIWLGRYSGNVPFRHKTVLRIQFGTFHENFEKPSEVHHPDPSQYLKFDHSKINWPHKQTARQIYNIIRSHIISNFERSTLVLSGPVPRVTHPF